jgi:hypothetical protein
LDGSPAIVQLRHRLEKRRQIGVIPAGHLLSGPLEYLRRGRIGHPDGWPAQDRFCAARLSSLIYGYGSAELIGAGEPHAAKCIWSDREYKSAAVGVAPAARVPITIGARAESQIFCGQALEGGVNGLFLGGRKPYCQIAPTLQGEDLRPEHARIRYANEPIGWHSFILQRLRNQEKPWAIGRTMYVNLLEHLIDLPFTFRQQCEIALGRRRERFYHILQLITVNAMEQVERQRRNFSVSQKERIYVPLGQVLAYRGVVGKVAIVHQSLVHANEWMGAAWMPDLTLGRIAMVPYPYVGAQPFDTVMPYDIIAIPDHLQNQHVLSMREHEGALLARGGIEGAVQAIARLVDDLILDLVRLDAIKPVLSLELFDQIGLHAHKVLIYDGRLDLKLCVAILDVADAINFEVRFYVAALHLSARIRIQIGYRQQVIPAKNFLLDAELIMVEPRSCYAAPFPVAAISHLFERPEQVAGRQLLARGDAYNATAAFRFGLACQASSAWREPPPRFDNSLRYFALSHLQ